MIQKTKFTAINLLIFLLLPGEQSIKEHEPEIEMTTRRIPELVHQEYTKEEMVAFWEENIGNLGQLCQTLCQTMPEIRQRFFEGIESVVKRFGVKNLEIRLQTKYDENKDVMWGAQVENGLPVVVIILPNLLNLERLLRKEIKEYKKEVLQLSVLVGILHEIDHLRYNTHEYLQKGRPFSIEEVVVNEKQAWGYTCRYTIAPLIEKYGMVLNPNHMAFYKDWIESGRDENSRTWEEKIRKTYRFSHPFIRSKSRP